jgi:DNA-binding NarL/FixJ family response regulator
MTGSNSHTEPIGVLVCDDTPELLWLVRTQLETHPGVHVVGEASDGDAVFRLALDLRPDVVLLDLHMPGLGFGDLVRGLRDALPAMAIVTYSGIDPASLGDADAAAAVAAHLPKTTDLHAVGQVVHDVGMEGRAS